MAGMADLVTVGETPVMFATMRGAPVAILATIATVAQSHGIVARRDRGIASPGDLSGKTIGLPLGGSAHFLLTGILAAHRIPVGSVQLRNMAPEELAPALAAGSVDAVAGWDPWLYRARQAAGSEAVTLYGDRGFAFWFHLVGRREAMEDNPERMRKVLRALTRAERLLESEPEVARAIVANATAMEPALFLESWPRYALRLKLHQGLLPMLEDQARWAMANGYVKPAPMPNFLDAIHMDALHAVRPDAVSIVH
jgi:NitT/TauT family transport system substrate-binding protein